MFSTERSMWRRFRGFTFPIFQVSTNSLAVFLRTRSDPETMKENNSPEMMHNIDPELPVFGVKTMEELMSASMAGRRFSLFRMSAFAAVALLSLR